MANRQVEELMHRLYVAEQRADMAEASIKNLQEYYRKAVPEVTVEKEGQVFRITVEVRRGYLKYMSAHMLALNLGWEFADAFKRLEKE